MKTEQELFDELIAECERVCPKVEDKAEIQNNVTIYRMGGKGHECFQFSTYGMNTYVHYRKDQNRDGVIAFHHRLMGLSERDAVEAYKASLQSDLNSMTAIVSRVKKGEQPDYVHVSELEAERAKVGKLVTSIKSLQIRAWDAFNKIELAAVQKGAVGRIRRQHTTADTKENEGYAGEILEVKRVFDEQVNELIAANEKGGKNES